MIKYFFIIDFFENIDLEMPIKSKKHFAGVVEGAKKEIVSKAKSSSGLIKKISDKNKNYNLYAKANEDNMIVCIITDNNDMIKDKIWEIIRSVFIEIKDLDTDKDEINSKRPAIKRLLNSHFDKDIVGKIDSLTQKSTIKVQNIKLKASQNAQDLIEALEEVNEIDEEAQSMESYTSEIRNHYWWENNKMIMLLGGLTILLVMFGALYLIGFFKKAKSIV